MSQRIVVVDAFASQAFRGNQAAVCVLESPRETDWMQALAGEMNLSETAFTYREDGCWRLRWFTPTIEVDLCGHATLATAHVLWESGELEAHEVAEFNTRSGRLTASQDAAWITLNFPSEPVQATTEYPEIEQVLGEMSPVFVGRNRMDLFVELESGAQVRSFTPRLDVLRKIPVRGLIATGAADTPEYDMISRFFAPACGIDEDPVCGSAHCALAPYWSARLGKSTLMAYQASARGGVLRLQMSGDRVEISGQATTVLHGTLTAAAMAVSAN